MSEEEKKAIKELNHYINITEFWKQKEYTNSEIDNYIKIVLNSFDKQQKEIEEKSTIIMAGAEKVKQLEKEIQRLEKDNDTLSELVIVNEDKVIKELDLISKDKIREKIKNIEAIYKKEMKPYQTEYGLNLSLLSKKEKEEVINKRNGLLTQKITLQELLEEK